MSEEIKIQLLQNRNALMSKVKRYIDTELNQSKKNYDSSKNDYEKVKSIDEILGLLEISKVEYETSLSTSGDKDLQLHLKRLSFRWAIFVGRKFIYSTNFQSLQGSCIFVLCQYLSISDNEMFSSNELSCKRGI